MASKRTGNPNGRPPRYTDPADMQAAIDKYFADCEANDKPTTVTGLALAIGFNSRQSLLNYEDKPQFLDPVKRAKARVEAEVEADLRRAKGNPAGNIFILKNNYGWADKHEVEASGGLVIQFRQPGDEQDGEVA